MEIVKLGGLCADIGGQRSPLNTFPWDSNRSLKQINIRCEFELRSIARIGDALRIHSVPWCKQEPDSVICYEKLLVLSLE